MARPFKKGIDSFPIDVNFMTDEKFRKIVHACGPTSISVIISLLCNIYGNDGYYMLWDENRPFDIAETLGVSEGTVTEVVRKAAQVEFFDKELFRSSSVLTSKRIQKTYFEAIRKRKCDLTTLPYLLIKPQLSHNSVERKPETLPQPAQQLQPANNAMEIIVPTNRITGCENNKRCMARFLDKNNRENIEKLMMSYQLKPNEYDKFVAVAEAVINEWNATGTSHQDYSDWARHLINLIRIKLQKTPPKVAMPTQQMEEERKQENETRHMRYKERESYAINMDQLNRLKALVKAGDKTAEDIYSGRIRMTAQQIDEYLKSVS